MKLKNLLKIFFATVLTIHFAQAQTTFRCLQEFTVNVLNGGDEVVSCAGDEVEDILELRSSSYATPIGYLVVNEQDIILKFSLRSFLNVDDLPAGEFKIYGFSFLGTPTLTTGMPLEETTLANICYELSDNFISLFNVEPDGQAVATTEGLSRQFICAMDGNPDIVSFQTTSPDPNYAYLVTTPEGIIEHVVTDNAFDFDEEAFGTSNVWGLSFVGDLTATVGASIFTEELASECFDLSDNFVEIIKTQPEGGQVELSTGETETVVCTGDQEADILTFEITNNSNAPFNFILTDSVNNALLVLGENRLDFDFLAPGVCRMWAVSFTGSLNVQIGQNLLNQQLSDDCFDLSDNFVTINKKNPTGGNVSLAGGSTEALFCVNDENPDLVTLFNTGGVNEQYAYLITDTLNQLVEVLNANSTDFEGTAGGNFRIWGLGFSGVFTGQIGADIEASVLSDECFELSQNFISITKVSIDPGTVALSSGATDTVLCFGDPQADILSFDYTTTSLASTEIRYILTDGEDNILEISTDNTIDFEGNLEDDCRLYGLSFTGTLTAQVGANVQEVLSTECYDLSQNFVSISHVFVEGGTVSLSDGGTDLVVCVQNGAADELSFVAQGAIEDQYAFLITDENNVITNIVEGNSFDFESTDNGTALVYGLSFSGSLTAQVGDDINATALASECFDLSENAVTITKKLLEAGSISLPSGNQDTLICFGDPQDDQLSFAVTGFNQVGNYRFLLTDDQNNILAIFEESTYDFINITDDNCRVWGVSFTGNLLAQVGDNAASTVLADECYDLTDDFVSIRHIYVEGGTVSLDDGSTELVVCVQNGTEDVLNFSAQGAIEDQYTFIITDENNIITDIVSGNSFDFESMNNGTAFVYGVSYSGNLTAQVGDDINFSALASECFDLSDNVITITKKLLEAGSISLPSGNQDTLICFGDPQDDQLSFAVTGFNQVGDYRFLLTDDQNNILAIFEESSYDFINITDDNCRVWGVSFTGNLLAQVGDNAANTVLSDECFDLTDDFVSIRHIYVEGGTISLDDESTELVICVQNGAADLLTFTSQGAIEDQYAYVVTDNEGIITNILISNNFDFENTNDGTALVYGVSFSGTFLAQVGDNINTTNLASECFDLSDNVITLTKKLLEAGTISMPSGNQDTILCYGDPTPDKLLFDVEGFNGVGAYRYVLTDGQDNILAITEVPMLDFERTNLPECKVYGLSFTGDLLAQVGDNLITDVLASECYDITDDFISILHVSVNGGNIILDDGSTRQVICVQNGESDLLTFNVRGAIQRNYMFVITDEVGNITNILDNNSFDFEPTEPGIARVFGVSFSGTFIAQIGDNILTSRLASECFDVSGNAINLTKKFLEAGDITLPSGRQDTVICFGDPMEDELSFVVDGFNNVGDFRFILTDAQNNVLDIFLMPMYDFDNIDIDTCRVWGLSYSGDLLLEVGGNLDADILASECYDVTDGFINIRHTFVEGGTISLADTSMMVTLCVQDGVSDLLAFQANDAIEDAYTFIITDESGIITSILSENNFDFDNEPEGTAFVYGVSYSGEITAVVGDDINMVAVASECFDLSDNTIEITKKQLEAGTIALSTGVQDTFLCFGNPEADILNFNISGFNGTGTYRYVVTDRQNIVLNIFESAEINFTDITNDQCKVYGVSFTGDFLLTTGDRLTTTPISTECYDLTDDFVTVDHVIVDGGTVSFSENSAGPTICSADGIPDIVEVVQNSGANANYTFVLTNETNNVILVLVGNSINLDIANAGVCRIWGVSHTGTLQINIGQDLTAGDLASECFDLSDNFVEIVKKDLLPGQVTLADGGTTTEVCAGEGVLERVQFTNTSPQRDENYVYAVTDESNRVLSVSVDSNVLFANVEIPTCRVYGIIYSGDLLLSPGDQILSTVISTECFEVTDNFVTVTHNLVDGGSVELSDGLLVKNICVMDGVPDVLELRTSSEADKNYTYLLTNERNQLLTVLNSNSIDLDGSVEGVVHIYGVSYTGEIILDFGEIVTEATISDDCFDLSDNFVIINRIDLEAGNISLLNGLTSTFVCFGDGIEDRLQFSNTAPANTDYAYLVTDQDDNLIKMSISPDIRLDEQNIPGARVYGLAYTGNLVTSATGNIFDAVLSTECTEITPNFVDITYFYLEGGNVSLSNGDTSTFVCSNDGNPDILSFQTDSPGNGDYSFILTDENNQIVLELQGNSINLDIVPAGICKIWGISFTGDLTIPIGGNLLTDQLAENCFDLSDNAITIRKEEVQGGNVSFEDGSTSSFACPNDGRPDMLTFTTNGETTDSYIYLITNEANELLSFANGNSFDFETVSDERCRVYGVAFSGQLTITSGDNIGQVAISDECADLSDNFLVVIKETPEAGSISTLSGGTSFDFCAQDGIPNIISLDSTNTFSGPYTYVLTDENGEYLNMVAGDQIDFDNLSSGSYRIYGIAFTGNLIAVEGSLVEEDVLSDDCFDLSDNFIEITNAIPNAGRISTADKDTLIYVCPDDNNPNRIQFFTEDQSPNAFTYILTNSDNIVLSVLSSNEFNFENPAPVFSRVWGLSYSGNLTVSQGMDLDDGGLSDDCFDLTDNFVEVVRDAPDVGTISTADGGNSFRICVNDGTSDLITFTTTENSEAPFILLVSDENNIIVDTIQGLSFDFEFSGEGISRIWGLSYTGNLNLAIGSDIQRTALSDDCFELTESFVEITKTEVDGGMINTSFNTDSIYVCPDGIDDIISFTNNSTALGGDYRYALTRPNGLILAYLDGNSRNFDNTSITELQVWGISFTGNFIDNAGRGRIDEVNHSDSCFTLSQNVITVFLDVPDGGSISTVDGATDVDFCASPRNSALNVTVNNNTSAGYALLLTDINGQIISVSTTSSINLSNVDRGAYRVYGLSYTGSLDAQAGMTVEDPALASSCFDLSSNFINVNRLGDVDGGEIALSDGSNELFSCPGDLVPDLAIMTTNSTLANTNYGYIITDVNNRVQITDLQPEVVDFDPAPMQVFRIWAVSFTGNISLQFGRDILNTELSSECYEVSSNFITVFNEGAQGGSVSTSDSLTTATVSLVGDATLTVMNEESVGRMYAYIVTDNQDNIIDATFENTVDFSALTTGEYKVYGLALNGNYSGLTGANILTATLSDACFELSDNFISVTLTEQSVEFGSEAEEVENLVIESAKLSLWPNPVQSELTISWESDQEGDIKFIIFDIFGRQVLNHMQRNGAKATQTTLDVSTLNGGMYLMVTVKGNKVIEHKKFMKTE